MTDVTLETLTCGGCGIVFALPERRVRELRETGETFTCPNGCSRHFKVKPTAIERERDRLAADVDYWTGQVELLGQQVKAERREARTCPLCGDVMPRTRALLRGHLEDEHGARVRMRALTQRAGEAS